MGVTSKTAAQFIVLFMAFGLAFAPSSEGENVRSRINSLVDMLTALVIVVRLCCNPQNQILAMLELLVYAAFFVITVVPVGELVYSSVRGVPVEPGAVLVGVPIAFIVAGLTLLLMLGALKTMKRCRPPL